MTNALPNNPSLEQLKNQAKDILKAHKSGQDSACGTLKLLTKFEDDSDQEILSATVTLQEVQHALAMDYGFDSWDALRQAVAEMDSNSTIVSDEDRQVISLVDKLLTDAIESRASDLHFEPFENSYRVRFRTEGRLHEVKQAPVDLGPRIAARLKVMSGIDIAERRVPQHGHIKVKISESRAIDFRVHTLPVLFGEKISLRVLDTSSVRIGMDALGFERGQKKLFLEALHKPAGLLLVTGPTGSGTTVTLYTGITLLNKPELEIYTVEDPVEINLDGVNQCCVDLKVGLDYESALRSCLMQDPDILLVGEIRDLAIANLSIKAAQTGHLVLSSMQTNGVPETLTHLRGMGVSAFSLTRVVSLVTAQRLVRRLCPACRVPLDIPKNALIDAGFSEKDIDGGLQIFGPGDCDKCSGGYKGRVGIHEVVKITPEIARVIMEGGNASQIAEECQRAGFDNIMQSALRKVKQGHTSLDEVDRVAGPLAAKVAGALVNT
jgi:type IV pilus assembly protein PilB|tara:strand:- start:1123 stop:2601 length:1479 start_codon:yes stop_codon:yes gene_type:complete